MLRLFWNKRLGGRWDSEMAVGGRVISRVGGLERAGRVCEGGAMS